MGNVDYHVTKHECVRFEINCESCGISTGSWELLESAIERAEKHGFVAYDTPEDGTLNFCPRCDVEPRPRGKLETLNPAPG